MSPFDWIVTLFVIGALLVFSEAFLPGLIAGIFGALALLAGVSVAFIHFGVEGGLLALVGAVVLVAFVLVLEFKILPRTALGRYFIHQRSMAAKSQPDVAPSTIVGQTGRVITPLRPSGLVEVGGRRLEAHSISGFIDKDATVRIVSLDGFKVTVAR